MLRKILYPISLIVVSLVFSLLVIEVGLRLFYPQQESMQWFESSKKYGYLVKKNFSQDFSYIGYDFVMHVQTNSLGHRYKEYNKANFDNPLYKKILLLGDSFMFGHGVNMEHHIATYLENMLNDDDSRHYLIINAGVSGWGTLQETTYARDNFTLFNPDIIILLFCSNDPDDDDNFIANISDNEKGVIYFPGKIFLRDNSHLYRFLYSRFHILLHNLVLKQKAKKQKDVIINEQSKSAITTEQWERSLKSLNEFHTEYLEYNKQGKLMILTTSPWNNDHREKLKTLSNGQNLLFVDLYNETVNLPPDKRRLTFDRHWSELIHYISAKKLSEIILSPETPHTQ
jgi:hypothetical protein